jgi:hypothetical protein
MGFDRVPGPHDHQGWPCIKCVKVAFWYSILSALVSIGAPDPRPQSLSLVTLIRAVALRALESLSGGLCLPDLLTESAMDYPAE